MDSALLTRLILPLSALSLASVGIHLVCKADGFFLNLATELIGILITIWYVDWIIRVHERKQWVSADKRIVERLRTLLNATMSRLRSGLGFGTDILDQKIELSLDPLAIHRDVIRVGEHFISPEALTRIQLLDSAGWDRLFRDNSSTHGEITTFLNMFQNRLNPDQIADLLDLQQALLQSLTHYTIFPDIMGVPSEKLPRSVPPPEVIQQFGCESTASEIRKICNLAKKLSLSLEPKTR